MGGATIAGASLVPVAPAFEAASNALKGHEAHALKGASSRDAARVRLRAALESAVKSKAISMRGRAMRALVAKFVPTRERSVRNGFCSRCEVRRSEREETAVSFVPL